MVGNEYHRIQLLLLNVVYMVFSLVLTPLFSSSQ